MPGTAPIPGTEIGPYRVRSLLGRGGMAEVLEVDGPGGEVRALKLLLPGALHQEVLTRFTSEHRTLAQLDHPGIVRVYERGEWQGRPWFAMERMEGRDLRELVEEWAERSPPDR
jgi:serine/threonine protein kinase